MTTKEILKLQEQYMNKRLRAEQNFQETGIQAYHWRANRYGDIEDVCGLALDGHDELTELRHQLTNVKIELMGGYQNNDPEQIVKRLRSYLKIREEI